MGKVKVKGKGKCDTWPLGSFGDYKGLSGCYWCEQSDLCIWEHIRREGNKNDRDSIRV